MMDKLEECGRIGHGPIEILSWYSSGETEESMKTSVRVADVANEIRTEYLPIIMYDLRFLQPWLRRVLPSEI
jgi:hypothetical protein